MPETKNANGSDSLWAAEARQLLDRAGRGDDTCLPELRQLLDERPEIWRTLGDLARHAELSLLRLVAGDNLLAQECVQRRLQALKAELLGPEPAPLERLLVDRVAVSWLQVHGLDLELAGLDKGKATGPVGFSAQRRLDSAQRRYLAAIKQLAMVRKLLPPRLAPLEISRRLGGRETTRRRRGGAVAGDAAAVLN